METTLAIFIFLSVILVLICCVNTVIYRDKMNNTIIQMNSDIVKIRQFTDILTEVLNHNYATSDKRYYHIINILEELSKNNANSNITNQLDALKNQTYNQIKEYINKFKDEINITLHHENKMLIESLDKQFYEHMNKYHTDNNEHTRLSQKKKNK